MKQHTPGPWVVGAHPEEDVYQVLAPEQHKYEAVIAAEVHEGANALLMSAAPDLLAACEAALEYIEDDNPGAASADAYVAGLCDRLRATIDKARGEVTPC